MNVLTQMYLTLDVYKPAGVIPGKRKQLEASEQGGKYIIAMWSQIVLSVNFCNLPRIVYFCTV